MNRVKPPKNVVYCKVGTKPALCIFDGRCNFMVGKKVRFRDAEHGSKWHHGTLKNLDPIRLDLV